VKAKPRVLFTSPILGHPAIGGPLLRIENSIKALSQITDLYIYSRVANSVKTGIMFYQDYCKQLYFAPSAQENGCTRISRRALDYLMRKMLKRNIIGDIDTRTDQSDLLKVAEAVNANIIWLGYGNISYPLLKFIKTNSNLKVVLDTDSVWSRFVLRGLPYTKDDSKRQKIRQLGEAKEEEERWGTQIADVTTAVSEVDAAYYRELAKFRHQVHLFSNVIDLESYDQVPLRAYDVRSPCIYLGGTFSPHSPMDDSARWVICEIMPLVRSRIPNIRLYIVGSGSDRTLSDINESDVTIKGKLQSVLPYLCHSDVALVPLRYESGTRFKILEAGACGVPVVSTTLGAEGLPVVHGNDILIADHPESIADSIIRLITDRNLASELGKNLRNLVLEQYSIARLAEEGSKILEYLRQGSTLQAPV